MLLQILLIVIALFISVITWLLVCGSDMKNRNEQYRAQLDNEQEKAMTGIKKNRKIEE